MTKKALDHPAIGTEITADGKIRTSWLIMLCRAKANQVMMMKRRGYEIDGSENDWLEASVDDSRLSDMVKMMLTEVSGKSTQVNFAKRFNRTYKIKTQTLNKQFTGEIYPYLRDEEDEIPERVGQFRLDDSGNLINIKDEEELITAEEHVTEVFFGNIPKIESRDPKPFHRIPSAIFIETGDESVYNDDQAVLFRMRMNLEIFHVGHMMYDLFQHWLVPSQRIISDVEKLILLCPYYINLNNEAMKNCVFLESQLPVVPMSDAAMRRLGAIPGDIIFWENGSYLTTLDNTESGYMLVTGVVSDVSKIVNGEEVQSEDDGQDMGDEDMEDMYAEDGDGGDDEDMDS